MKKKITSAFSSIPGKDTIITTLSSVPMKEKVIAAASSIPFIAAATMSGSCAAGCPYGLSNDPYPGQCSRYIDMNGDGICDLSQTTTAASTDTSTTSTDTQTTSTSTDHGHNGANAEPTTPDPPADTNATLIPDSSGLDTENLSGDPTNYHVLPVTLMIIVGYLSTYYLFKKGILKRNKHRRIWNMLVTAGYLGTSVTGIILVLMINLGIKTVLNPSLTFWHVELAILMVVCTLIHIHIRWKPFKNMFRVLFGFKTTSKKVPAKAKRTSK